MAASETTVRKRVTEILNACSPGTYSEAVDINYQDRNSLAIRQAIKEAALQIARAIVVNPGHVHRGLFVSDTPTSFTHGAELPDMAGEMDLVEIQPYSGGTWQTGVSREIQQIESFRANPSNLYSSLSHTTATSPLGGYYALSNNKIYFTGYACRGYFPTIDDTTVINLIPDEYEGTWVALAVARTIKEGDNLQPVAQYYYQIGLSDLAAVTNMNTTTSAPTAEQARKIRGDV
jgi:hypothetical protein